MAINWTPQQEDAIAAKGSVIVTAAAGSGKTAVLVERVIEKLCDGENPVPADRLLIVTFTRAAAAEMRGRIEKRLSERQAADPTNVLLNQQQLLLSSADICTIDSFCIKLVRQYFNILDISPDFDIADNHTALEIRNRVMEDLFKEEFEKNDPDFFRFLNTTDSIYGDGNAIEAVNELYDFTSTMAQSERWLCQAAAVYEAPLDINSPFVTIPCGWLAEDIPLFIKNVEDVLQELTTDPLLEAKSKEICEGFLTFYHRILAAAQIGDMDVLSSVFTNPPTAMPRLTSKKYDPYVLGMVVAVGKQFKAFVSEFSDCFCGGFSRLEKERLACKNTARYLVNLCLAFSKRYLAALKERDLLTFSHTEKLALQLLSCEDEMGNLVPTKIAETVSHLYDEVMVDEFQDVNDLQSRLFDILSDGGRKLFTVGDAKQSIYGFRGANPEHFMRRSEAAQIYHADLPAEAPKRVVLSTNFRSNAEICRFVNGFFGVTMSKEFGGIDYDENERLYPFVANDSTPKVAVEAHFIGKPKGISAAEAEGIFLADYVEQTLAEEPFVREDANGKELRRAHYGDVALLFRKSTNFSTYVRIFKERGIPVTLGHGDFFKTTEVQTILSLLRVIDRPLNDTAMLSVLLSPLFGFSEEEVLLLKKISKNERFYRTLLRQSETDKKCAYLRDKLAFWREKSACMPLSEFVGYLLKDSGYDGIVLSLSDAKRRRNNLIFLEELAASYAENKGSDLGGFLKHLDYLAKAGDLKSQTPKESNAVTLMTTHMSKGLQFPITVLGDCFSAFNRKETLADIAFFPSLGMAFQLVDDLENCKYETYFKQVVNRALLRKQWEEELRLFYVATTRAKDRLVLCLTAESPEKKIQDAAERCQSGLEDGGSIRAFTVQSCHSVGEWICMYLMLLPIGKELYPEIENYVLPKDIALNEVRVSADILPVKVQERNVAVEKREVSSADPDEMKAVSEILDYRYPFAELRLIETKTSVSALTKRKAGREFCATTRPAFLSAGGLTPTERGTALHKFMQYADFKAAKENPTAEIERLYEAEFISRAEADSIEMPRVKAFLQTELFARMMKADRLYREQRFMLAVKAGEVYPNLSPQSAEASVIVQGAVDCIFVAGDHLVIIDFKTDRTNEEEFLLFHYAEQLRTYCHAAEKMFSLPVLECYIYSLHMGKSIPVSLA